MKIYKKACAVSDDADVAGNTVFVVGQIAALNPATGFYEGANATTPLENIRGIWPNTPALNDIRTTKNRKTSAFIIKDDTIKIISSIIGGNLVASNRGDNFNLAANGYQVDISITGAANLKHFKLLEIVNATTGIFVLNRPVSLQ